MHHRERIAFLLTPACDNELGEDEEEEDEENEDNEDEDEDTAESEYTPSKAHELRRP